MVGFLTTFSLLARDRMGFSDVSWMLINGLFRLREGGVYYMHTIY